MRLALLLGGCVVACQGCARDRAVVELCQPRAEVMAERKLTLESEAVWYNVDGERASYLMELPLPGATAGAQYRVYLRLANATGRHVIGSPVASGGFEAGYLVHLKGRGAGMTECVSGTAEVSGANRGRRSGELALRFADGSRLTGRFVASENGDRLRRYEHEAVEVRPLLRGETGR